MREIRPYGSVRGVRSNPYPYRDNRPPAAEGSATNGERTKTINGLGIWRGGQSQCTAETLHAGSKRRGH